MKKQHLLIALRLAEIVAVLVTLLYALPTAYATYQCNFNGRSCQYSLFGPSDEVTSENAQRLASSGTDAEAEFEFVTIEKANNDKRTDLNVRFDGGVETVFSKPHDQVVSYALSDDRKTALVFSGPRYKMAMHVANLDPAGQFVLREYEFYCGVDEGLDAAISIANLQLSRETNSISFDLNSNCSTREIQPNWPVYFGSSWETDGRVTLAFDDSFFLVGVYPNPEWDRLPTAADVAASKASQDLITEQQKLSDDALEQCVEEKRREIKRRGLTNFLFMCETPDILADQPTYWKIKNDKMIVAGPNPGSINVVATGCDSSKYEVQYTENVEYYERCSGVISEKSYSWIVFVDETFGINELTVSCECFDVEFANTTVGEASISFDVAGSTPRFGFDEKKLVLGGDNPEHSYGHAAYRGRVTATFHKGGWLKDVSFVYE